MRKRIQTFGRRGQLVRVMEVTSDGVKRYVVQWGTGAARGQQSFPNGKAGKAEALAFAEAFVEEAKRGTQAPAAPITTRALWMAYQTAEFPHLRPRTRALYREYWTRWERFYGLERAAGAMRIEDAEQFRAELERIGLATATIQKTITTVRGVYNWAERTERIDRNRWHAFRLKVAKERRTKTRAEYRQAEFLAIWRQFDPTDRWQWRAYVAIGLLGIYGMRQNAVLHLQLADLDEDLGTLTFQPEWDKQGETHVLPLLPLTRELLAVAKAWREREAYTGPWLLFAGRAMNKGETYTIQSLWKALQRAERDAGIQKVRFRGGHAFRRGLVGDLLESGNDMDLALKAIGDRDLRMAKHYAVRRDERIEKALQQRVDAWSPTPTDTREDATNVQRESAYTVDRIETEGESNAVTHSLTEGY